MCRGWGCCRTSSNGPDSPSQQPKTQPQKSAAPRLRRASGLKKSQIMWGLDKWKNLHLILKGLKDFKQRWDKRYGCVWKLRAIRAACAPVSLVTLHSMIKRNSVTGRPSSARLGSPGRQGRGSAALTRPTQHAWAASRPGSGWSGEKIQTKDAGLCHTSLAWCFPRGHYLSFLRSPSVPGTDFCHHPSHLGS